MNALVNTPAWQPPSRSLTASAGVWRGASVSAVSYPAEANDAFLAIEETSFWFRHRLACIAATFGRQPPPGDFYDVGGGNGYVAAGLARLGWPTVLVEPGSGAQNARELGLTRIVQATLEDARFQPGSLPAIGAFDVLEHIADDRAFMRLVRQHLAPGGRFYCTVPASPTLWSDEDDAAGHLRRYRGGELVRLLRTTGFEIEFVSPFFAWLVWPVFFLRTLPAHLRSHRPGLARWSPETHARAHRLPSALVRCVERLHAREIMQLRAGRPLRAGTSLLAVARAPSS